MDYPFILYILLSVVLGVYVTFRLVKTDRSLTAFLYLVGVILILVYFGLRWFSGSTFALGDMTPKQWPPVLNACPDFLTLYDRPVPGSNPPKTEKVCVDLIGVAGAGGIQQMTDPSQLSDPKYVFNLSTNKAGAERTQALCNECAIKKVAWEGIFDGVACSSRLPPAVPI